MLELMDRTRSREATEGNRVKDQYIAHLACVECIKAFIIVMDLHTSLDLGYLILRCFNLFTLYNSFNFFRILVFCARDAPTFLGFYKSLDWCLILWNL